MNGRREFVRALGALVMFATGVSFAAEKPGRTYSVSVLGDLHYDVEPAETYHAEYIRLFTGKKENQWGFGEFRRNARMWKGVCPKVVAASGKTVRGDCAFVLQLGDLIQGDCELPEVHRKMLEDATDYVRAAYPAGLPFLTVCGNHDLRTGSNREQVRAAYYDYHRKLVEASVGTKLVAPDEEATCAFRQGPDLFVVVNFNNGWSAYDRVQRILAANTDVRYTFLLLHGGVFPYDFWSRYFFLGNPRADALRRNLRAVLAARNAIVLSGHTHFLEFREAKFPEGTITEMTLNTVDDRGNPAVPRDVREGVGTYGQDKAFLAAISNGEALFDEYRPYMTRHYHAVALGHGILRVSDDEVAFDYYGHDALMPTKTFVLRRRGADLGCDCGGNGMTNDAALAECASPQRLPKKDKER